MGEITQPKSNRFSAQSLADTNSLAKIMAIRPQVPSTWLLHLSSSRVSQWIDGIKGTADPKVRLFGWNSAMP